MTTEREYALRILQRLASASPRDARRLARNGELGRIERCAVHGLARGSIRWPLARRLLERTWKLRALARAK